jgi:CubicO group peptidase (beta-lactamase class C family)
LNGEEKKLRPLDQKLRKSFSILLIVLCLQVAAPAQSLDTSSIDKLVEDAMKAWQVPGAAVAIVQGDKVVHLKGYGVKALGSSEAVTPDTLFAIGSTTKAFTTTAMAMLVDEGKMGWDDPVRKHVEYFRLSDPLANEYVTMRDIVCHRTGLGRHDLLWYGSPWSREEIIRRIGLVKLSQPLRSAYQYQNIMFLTAGQAVGLISKSTWEDFIQKRIFDPLGMTGANFSIRDAARAADHATPHNRNGQGKVEVIPWRNIDNIAPAGAINAGVRDLSRWVQFQLGDGTMEGKRLVSKASLDETHTPQMLVRVDPASAQHTETTFSSYGLGWGISDYRGHLLIAHGGGIDGFLTNIILIPKAKIGIVVLSNLSPTPFTGVVGRGLVDLLLGLSKKDWVAIANEQMKKAEMAGKIAQLGREAKRHKDTKPSRDLAAYTGAYEDPAYGTANVSVEQGALVFKWSNFKSKLDHFHFDTFTAKGDTVNDETVIFTLGADGEVSSMSVLGVDFKKVKVKP